MSVALPGRQEFCGITHNTGQRLCFTIERRTIIGMGLGELYISLLLLKSLSLQQSYILKACAMSPDPPACYDNLPSRLDLQDAMVYGAWGPPPRFTPGQFYHYVDPQPIQQQHYPKTCQPTTRYPSCQ
jgi:hypothetical protein